MTTSSRGPDRPSAGALGIADTVYVRYALAVGAVAVGWLAREALTPAVGPAALPFLFFFPAVAFAAWNGRLGPGLLSIALSAAAAYWSFLRPGAAAGAGSQAEIASLLAFTAASLFIVGAIHAMHRANARLARSAAEPSRVEDERAHTREMFGATLESVGRLGDAVARHEANGAQRGADAVGQRGVGLLFAATAAMLAASMLFVYELGLAGVASERKMSNQLQVIQEVDNYLSLLKDTETGQRGYLLTGDEAYLAPYASARGRVQSKLDDLRRIAASGELPIERVERVASLSTEKLGELERTIELRRNGSSDAALALVRDHHGKQTMDLLRAELESMSAGEEQEFREAAVRAESVGATRTRAFVAAGALNLVFLGLAFGHLSRALRRRAQAMLDVRRQKEVLATTLTSIGDGVITIDTEGRVTLMNAVAESLTGWTQKDAIGRPLESVFRIVNEQTRETAESPASRALREGVVVAMTNPTVLVARDGSELPIDDSAAPIQDPSRQVVGCVLIFRSIADRRVRERQLAERARLLDLSNDTIFARDARDRITYWNKGAEAAYGYTRDEALGQVSHELLKTEFAEPREAIYEKFRREGHWSGELVRSTRDGVRVTDASRWALERDAQGNTISILETNLDITERKRSENERKKLLESERAARTEAENASRVKDEFLATLSHELRTPLNAILGWSRLIDKNPSDAKNVHEGIQVITRNARVQADLIADLLDMNRIIAGKLRLEICDVDLPEVVSDAIDAVRHGAEAKEIRIEPRLGSVHGVLRGDPSRLQQVVWNLLSNAVKFTPKGGTIEVVLADQTSHVEIVVRDSGMGIEPEFLPHLFERFRQGDASAARQHGGLGLGLSIAKHLVEVHGGSLRAESAGRGSGSTFKVVLPLISARAPEVVASEQPRAQIGAGPDLRGVKALAIDDQADARELLARVLEENHAEVFVAASAAEGLAAMVEHRPHIVLCDIGMPGEDGFQFIREMRRRGDETPAVAVTAFARSEDRLRALRAGYQAHVTKPVEPAELVATIAVFAKASTGRAAGASP